MKRIDEIKESPEILVDERVSHQREFSEEKTIIPDVSAAHFLQENKHDENYGENRALLLEESINNKKHKDEVAQGKEDAPENKIEIIENAENNLTPQEIVAAIESGAINQGTVQPLPDSGYVGSWGQVDSMPRELDLSNVRITLPEKYADFYPLDLGRSISETPVPFNPPTAENDIFSFSANALPINLTLMLDISGSMRDPVNFGFSKMLLLQQTLLGENGLIYTISQLSDQVDIWVIPTPSTTDFYTDDDVQQPNHPQLFSAQYFSNDPHAAMEYILTLFPSWNEYYDAAMQYGLDTLGTQNPMFAYGEQNLLYFIADGIPVYGPIGETGDRGGDPNIIANWQAALGEYDADTIVIGVGGEAGTPDALAPVTNGVDPSKVLETDTVFSDFSDLILSGTQQINGNLLTNDSMNEATGPSEPLMITSFQQGGNVGAVGIPFITALGATLIVNADGTFTYEVPFSLLQDMDDVTESFNYTISNGYGSDTAVFEIEVEGIDTPIVEFTYAVDDVVSVYDDITALQTIEGNVLHNDNIVGSASITAATSHMFITGDSSNNGHLFLFENHDGYESGDDHIVYTDMVFTSFTLYNDGRYVLTELVKDGFSQAINAMENTLFGSYKIAYGVSGDYGADIGFLEFVLASESPDGLGTELDLADILTEDSLFNSESTAAQLPALAENGSFFAPPSQDINQALGAEIQQNIETFG